MSDFPEAEHAYQNAHFAGAEADARSGGVIICDAAGGTLKQRKADYDEARGLSDGSDSRWSDSDGDSGNETAPEMDIGPPTLEDAGLVTVHEGDLVEEGLRSLLH